MQTPSRVMQNASAARRLAELGLSIDGLLRVIDLGDEPARRVTRFNPASAAGWRRWDHTVGELREWLSGDGWILDDDRQLPRIVHPSGRFSVAVAAGDLHTGDPDVDPTTKHGRGPVAREAVQVNRQQMSLFSTGGLLDPKLPRVPRDNRVTYFLLVAADGPVVRSELSRPSVMDDSGRPIAWAERIILPPVDRSRRDVTLPEPKPVDTEVLRRRA